MQLKKLVAALEDVQHSRNTPDMLYRYLKARSWDVDAAAEMFRCVPAPELVVDYPTRLQKLDGMRGEGAWCMVHLHTANPSESKGSK